MNEIHLHRLDLNLLVVFEALMDERSVTRAADRLGKTPSAVSHALGRLRDQLDDPLMVKVGGKMQPSPFAEALIRDVRPVLVTIQQVVQPPKPFDPAASKRRFRLSIPASAPLIAAVSAEVHAAAPGVDLEWLPVTSDAYTKVAEGDIDLAISGNATFPEGATGQLVATMKRYTFARADHPAIAEWSEAAWRRWPHVVVGMANAARQTVEERVRESGIDRRIGALIPEFSGVSPLLASTDMLANQVAFIIVDDILQYGLCILEPPVDLPDLDFHLVWNARLSNEPGLRWLRDIVLSCSKAQLERSEAVVRKVGVIRAA